MFKIRNDKEKGTGQGQGKRDRSNSVWWYTGGLFGVRAASYTWVGAQNFFNFTTGSGRGRLAPNASTLALDDVIHL